MAATHSPAAEEAKEIRLYTLDCGRAEYAHRTLVRFRRKTRYETASRYYHGTSFGATRRADFFPNAALPTSVFSIPSSRVAEMSPDEKYLAAIAVHLPKGVPPTAELQVWDFRRGTLLQAHSLSVSEARQECLRETGYLRYTSDGQLLAVYTGGDLLHVVRSTEPHPLPFR